MLILGCVIGDKILKVYVSCYYFGSFDEVDEYVSMFFYWFFCDNSGCYLCV